METPELKSLIEEQGRTFEQFKQALKAEVEEIKTRGGITPETKAAIDAMNARFDQIEVALKRPVRAGQGDAPEPTPLISGYAKFFRYGLRGNAAMERMTAEEKAAFAELRTKSLSVSTDTAGGFLVPEDFQAMVIRKIANIAGMGQLVSRVTTSRDVVRWPKVNYTSDNIHTSGLSLTWEDETDTATATDPSPFGSVAIAAKKVRALVKISRELLEDEAVDVMALLTDLAGDAFAVEEDNVFTVGSGGKKPEGFMTNTDIPTTNSGSSGAFAYNGLTNLCYALPNQYTGNAQFLTKRASLALLRQIVDSQGRPIWEPSLQPGTPASLLGYPIRTNEHIASAGAAARALAFADFKRLYMAVDKVTMSVQRLDEKYADTDEVGFIFRRRLGGAVIAPWSAQIQVLS